MHIQSIVPTSSEPVKATGFPREGLREIVRSVSIAKSAIAAGQLIKATNTLDALLDELEPWTTVRGF